MANLKLLWTPDPGTWPAADADALILSQEGQTQLSETVTVQPGTEPGLAPDDLRVSFPDGKPINMSTSVVKNANRLNLYVDVENWVGLFPIRISYMADTTPTPGLNQQSETVDNWQAVPAQTGDVYAYIPSSDNIRQFRMSVDALAGNGQLIETAVYTCTVYSNYDIGRDALKEKVQQRKDATSCQL